MTVTGKDLINLGFEQGPALGKAIDTVNALGLEGEALAGWVQANKPAPRIKLQDNPGYQFNLEAETEDEVENVAKVKVTMDKMMRTPTLVGGAVMPDACPSGPEGTIPVGGVAVAKNAIHPGMHSADICCSVMVTEFADAAPEDVMNAVHEATHFGPGGRPNGMRFTMSPDLYDAFRENAFLNDKKILQAAQEHLGTQGDGNHFAFVGVSEANGTTCLVTHHGSRGPGAGLYKLGMRYAEGWRKKLSEGVLKQNAWIPADSEDGVAYWEALQLIRKWTKANHNALHQRAAVIAGADMRDRFWNEHNFVFRKEDLFFHAKGATPIDTDLLPDTNGTQIIPMNMAEPVLLVRGAVHDGNLGFAPHGAGRNMSRTAHKRALEGRTDQSVFDEETEGLDVRFYSGNVDVSELPSAYKSAATVQAQMKQFDLADTVDRIQPYGSIMAGDWERDAPWKKKAAAKRAARLAREART
ncbi:MAG: RtcB family protein [Pseudomonadota bacterium]